MDKNPITRPMSTLLDRSVKAAAWLRDADQYVAGIALARILAEQMDEVLEGGGLNDPDHARQFHMRMVPNFQKQLYSLGLTPEGYAKMSGSLAAPATGGGGKGGVKPPAGVASPLDPAAESVDPLAALIEAEEERSKIIKMADHR